MDEVLRECGDDWVYRLWEDDADGGDNEGVGDERVGVGEES